MKTHHWNIVSGVIYLLFALFTLIGSGVLAPGGSSVEWYTSATIVIAFLAAAVFFIAAWSNHRRVRSERERADAAPPAVETEA